MAAATEADAGEIDRASPLQQVRTPEVRVAGTAVEVDDAELVAALAAALLETVAHRRAERLQDVIPG